MHRVNTHWKCEGLIVCIYKITVYKDILSNIIIERVDISKYDMQPEIEKSANQLFGVVVSYGFCKKHSATL